MDKTLAIPTPAKEKMVAGLSLEAALASLQDKCKRLLWEEIATNAAVNRILAQQIVCDCDVPSSNLAVMDGYAIALDGCEGDYRYHTIHPEHAVTKGLSKGEASFVNTGDVLPRGTEVVIPHEKINIQDGTFVFSGSCKHGLNIRFRGEDFRCGEVVIEANSVISPGMIGAMIALGIKNIKVIKLSKIAILSLDPKIASADLAASNAATVDSIGPMLAALVAKDGGVIENVLTNYDNQAFPLENTIQNCLKSVDILLTVGGTYSLGKNVVMEACRGIGAEIIFGGLGIKPGGHSGAAVVGEKLVLALSGHSAACAVGYQLLVQPVLRMYGGLDFTQQCIEAVCAGDEIVKLSCRTFLRGNAYPTDQGWRVEILPGQKSTMKRSLMRWNALIDVGERENQVGQGSRVLVRLQT